MFGKVHKETIRNLISISIKLFYGHTHTEKTRIKISTPHLGKRRYSESRYKINRALKGK